MTCQRSKTLKLYRSVESSKLFLSLICMIIVLTFSSKRCAASECLRTPADHIPEISIDGFPTAEDMRRGEVSLQKGNEEAAAHETGRAFMYYQDAAYRQSAEGEYNLAICYHEGIGTPIGYETARKLFSQAAKQNIADAEYDLALMELKGEGGPKDMVDGMACMRKAAADGQPNAVQFVDHLKPAQAWHHRGLLDAAIFGAALGIGRVLIGWLRRLTTKRDIKFYGAKQKQATTDKAD